MHGESGCMSHDNSGQHTTYPSGHRARARSLADQAASYAVLLALAETARTAANRPTKHRAATKRALAFSCHLSLARAGNDEPLDEPRGGRGGGACGGGDGGPPDGGGDTRPRGGDHQVSQDTQNLNFATTAPASRSVRRRRAASECWVIIHDDHSCRQQARCDCPHPPSHTASMCGGSVGCACRRRSRSTRE